MPNAGNSTSGQGTRAGNRYYHHKLRQAYPPYAQALGITHPHTEYHTVCGQYGFYIHRNGMGIRETQAVGDRLADRLSAQIPKQAQQTDHDTERNIHPMECDIFARLLTGTAYLWTVYQHGIWARVLEPPTGKVSRQIL